MKTILLLLLIGQEIFAQSTQWGLVREYNSGKKPIDDASVLFYGATSTVSDVEGKFTLTFKSEKKPGSKITYEDINKAGYEVVNKTQLDALRFSLDGRLAVDIILAKKGIIDAVIAEFAGASRKALTKSFEKENEKLKNLLLISKLNEEQLQEAKEKLQKSFDTQSLYLNQYAERFARIDIDNIDSVYIEALEMYKKGYIQESIKKIENTNPLKQTALLLKEEKSIIEIEKELSARKKELINKKKQQISMLLTLVEMYMIELKTEKANEIVDQILDLGLNDVEIIREVSALYQVIILSHLYLKEYDNALPYSLKLFKILANTNLNDYDTKVDFISCHATLSSIYESKKDYVKALEYLKYSKKHISDLIEKYPNDDYLKRRLAWILRDTGELEQKSKNIFKAIDNYKNSLKLLSENQFTYTEEKYIQLDISELYKKLGELHQQYKVTNVAKEYYNTYLNILKELYIKNPLEATIIEKYAFANFDLSVFYLEEDYEISFNYAKESKKKIDEILRNNPNSKIAKYKKMVDEYYEKINILVAKESNNLRLKIKNESDNQLKTSLYKSLVQALKTENASSEEITQTLNTQAWYSLLTGKFDEAEKLINQGIGFFPENKFLYTNLPPALLFQGKIKEATELYKKYAKEPFREQELPLYKDAFLDDFKAFEEAGIIPEQYKNEVEKIKKMLNEL